MEFFDSLLGWALHFSSREAECYDTTTDVSVQYWQYQKMRLAETPRRFLYLRYDLRPNLNNPEAATAYSRSNATDLFSPKYSYYDQYRKIKRCDQLEY